MSLARIYCDGPCPPGLAETLTSSVELLVGVTVFVVVLGFVLLPVVASALDRRRQTKREVEG